ncbi:MAG: NAD(P)-dependent oxidoreductase, partial [Actinomycetota bacterium]
MTFGYPVFLALDGVPVLVVGGGEIALRKVSGLVAAGARVTVVAPAVRPELAAMAAEV